MVVYLYGYRFIDQVKLRHVPGPNPSWLFGNLFSITHLAQDMTAWAHAYGPVYKFFLGGRPVIVVNDAELGRKVFMKSHQRPINTLTPPSGGIRRQFQEESLFWSYGQQFKRLKSAWQVAFNQESVHNYFDLMCRHADQFCDVVNKYAESGEVFDVYENVQKMTLEVVGTTAFGIEFGSFAQKDHNGSIIQADKLIGYLRTIFGVSKVATSGSNRRTPWSLLNMLFPEMRRLWANFAAKFPIGQRDIEALTTGQLLSPGLATIQLFQQNISI
eukprot:TRINITY_DN7861_c0_g1_i12.p1 TRINITY_DN7861_c0_g1~~TRINITY_DN7861_c0_g1_i12.p1  ORF type:complete len:314 (-),score=30.87 TRINITY_DN7861_c0_g1_i12:2214-3029(-)